MDPVDRFRTRLAQAIGGMMVTLVATVGGIVVRSAQEASTVSEPATSLSFSLCAGLLTSLPGIFTLIGIAGATIIAGPLGFVGALLEVAGANQILFYQNVGGLWMIIFGAALVTIGVPIPWSKIL